MSKVSAPHTIKIPNCMPNSFVKIKYHETIDMAQTHYYIFISNMFNKLDNHRYLRPTYILFRVTFKSTRRMLVIFNENPMFFKIFEPNIEIKKI